MAAFGTDRTRLTRVGSWVLSAFVLAAAWFVVANTPTLEDKRASFDVKVEPGEWGVGRNIEARVVGATFADHLDDQSWQAPGNWFIVQIEAAAVADADTASLGIAELTVDGITYSSTERSTVLIRGTSLLVGVPLSGVLAFDLPAEVRDGTAELRLGLGLDQRLDSIIVVPIDLAAMTRVPTLTVYPPGFPEP